MSKPVRMPRDRYHRTLVAVQTVLNCFAKHCFTTKREAKMGPEALDKEGLEMGFTGGCVWSKGNSKGACVLQTFKRGFKQGLPLPERVKGRGAAF